MDKNDRKAALERELAYYNQSGNDNKAKQVREALASYQPKPKADKAPERDGGETVERAVVEPTAEKAVINRPTVKASKKA